MGAARWGDEEPPVFTLIVDTDPVAAVTLRMEQVDVVYLPR